MSHADVAMQPFPGPPSSNSILTSDSNRQRNATTKKHEQTSKVGQQQQRRTTVAIKEQRQEGSRRISSPRCVFYSFLLTILMFLVLLVQRQPALALTWTRDRARERDNGGGQEGNRGLETRHVSSPGMFSSFLLLFFPVLNDFLLIVSNLYREWQRLPAPTPLQH